jgi:hypothetical protein
VFNREQPDRPKPLLQAGSIRPFTESVDRP